MTNFPLKKKLLFFTFGLVLGALGILAIFIIQDQYCTYIDESFDLKAYPGNGFTCGKTAEELQPLLAQAIKQRDFISMIFPPNGYKDFIDVIETMEGIGIDHNVNVSFTDIEARNRHFYEQLRVTCNLVGELDQIKQTVRDLDKRYPLIWWQSMTLDKEGEEPCLNINFMFFTYIVYGHYSNVEEFHLRFSYVEYLKQRIDEIEKMEIKTWLPPFSIWIKNLKKVVLDLYEQDLANTKIHRARELCWSYKALQHELYKMTSLTKELEKDRGKPLDDLFKEYFPEIAQDQTG